MRQSTNRGSLFGDSHLALCSCKSPYLDGDTPSAFRFLALDGFLRLPVLDSRATRASSKVLAELYRLAVGAVVVGAGGANQLVALCQLSGALTVEFAVHVVVLSFRYTIDNHSGLDKGVQCTPVDLKESGNLAFRYVVVKKHPDSLLLSAELNLG